MPMITSISPSPIDRGGKMKWKLAVSANWTRERVSASTSSALALSAAVCRPGSGLDHVDHAAPADEVGHEARPAGLVRGADAGAGVAVEVLVEQQQVVPIRVGLELLDRPEDRPPAVLVGQPDRDEPSARCPPKRRAAGRLARSGRVVDREVVAHERVPVPERHDDEVVRRHPDRSAPVRVAAEQARRRFAGLVVDLRGQPAELELERGVAVALRQRAQAVRRQEPVLGQHLGQQAPEADRRDDADLAALVTRPAGDEAALAEQLLADVHPLHEPREALARATWPRATMWGGMIAVGSSGITPTIEWTLIGTLEPSASLSAS